MLSTKVVNSLYKSAFQNVYYKNSIQSLCRSSQRGLVLPYSLKTPMPVDDQETKDALNYLDKYIYPEIIDEIKKIPHHQEIPAILDRLKSTISYNVPHGKRFRSIRIMKDFKIMADPQDVNLENKKLSAVASWVVEFLHTVILILDDLMDGTELRRGKTPWFKLPGIGLNAVTDAGILEMFAYDILRKYFENHKNYTTIIHILQRSMFVTQLGQGFDFCCVDPDTKKIKFDVFNIDWYNSLCKFKTMHQTVLLPFQLTLALANKYDAAKVDQVYHIFLEMGIFFQIQNDFKDFFKDQGEVLTKNDKPLLGTDIQTGQMTWFAVQTLAKGNEDQKKILKENYGKKDKNSVEAILHIYEQLKLDVAFMDYETSSYNYVCKEIRKINNGLPQELFENYVESVYKRRLSTI